eukprot:UN04715
MYLLMTDTEKTSVDMYNDENDDLLLCLCLSPETLEKVLRITENKLYEVLLVLSAAIWLVFFLTGNYVLGIIFLILCYPPLILMCINIHLNLAKNGIMSISNMVFNMEFRYSDR